MKSGCIKSLFFFDVLLRLVINIELCVKSFEKVFFFLGGYMFFSLRNRLFITFTLLLTIPFLILSIIIPSWFTTIMEKQIQDSTVEMMEQYSLYIDSIATQAEDLGKQVIVNPSTQQWLKLEKEEEGRTNDQSLLIENQMKMQLSSLRINNSNEMSVSVFLNDGTGVFGGNSSLPSMEWFKDFSENDQRWVKTHIDSFQQYQDMRESGVNSYLLPLLDLSTFERSGVIKVNFPSSLLETALGKIKLGEKGHVYLVNNMGVNVLSGQVDIPEYVLNRSLEKITTNKHDK